MGGGGRRAVRKSARSGFEGGGGWEGSRGAGSGGGGEVGVGGSSLGEAQSQPIDAVGEVEGCGGGVDVYLQAFMLYCVEPYGRDASRMGL